MPVIHKKLFTIYPLQIVINGQYQKLAIFANELKKLPYFTVLQKIKITKSEDNISKEFYLEASHERRRAAKCARASDMSSQQRCKIKAKGYSNLNMQILLEIYSIKKYD